MFAAVLSTTSTSIDSDFCSRVRNEARAKQFYFAKATVTNPLNNARGTIPPPPVPSIHYSTDAERLKSAAVLVAVTVTLCANSATGGRYAQHVGVNLHHVWRHRFIHGCCSMSIYLVLSIFKDERHTCFQVIWIMVMIWPSGIQCHVFCYGCRSVGVVTVSWVTEKSWFDSR